MRLIPLTQGKFAQVDDDIYNFLMKWKWHANKIKGIWYAMRSSRVGEFKKRKKILMHRVIMETPDNMEVDHQDHNGLNCQRYNMRNCSEAQNTYNKTARGASKYLGVTIRKAGNITASVRNKYLGTFQTEKLAAQAYDIEAKIQFGEFANLNFK